MTASNRAVFEIPFQPRPQRFTVTLNGLDYNIRSFWCGPMGCWVINIADSNDNDLVNGIPLITGTNLVGQYQDLIPGQLLVISDHGPADHVPGYSELGSTGHVFWINP